MASRRDRFLAMLLVAESVACVAVFIYVVSARQAPEPEPLRAYGVDAMTDELVVRARGTVPEHFELEHRIVALSSLVSATCFDACPIEATVQTEGNAAVAVVDLREPKDDRRGWRTLYFQGSTGGRATSLALRHSFLQPEYPDPWVDAVRFLYEGEPITEEWDHIQLSGTFRRDELMKQEGP